MGWIYFIRFGADGPVKVGYANNVRKRLATLQIGSPVPLAIVGIVEAARSEEKRLHARLSDQRLRGEWFVLDEPFLAELLETLKGGQMPMDYRRKKPWNPPPSPFLNQRGPTSKRHIHWCRCCAEWIVGDLGPHFAQCSALKDSKNE